MDLPLFIKTLKLHREQRNGPSSYASDKVFALCEALRVERDELKAAIERRCRWPSCDCYSPQGPKACRRALASEDSAE